MALREHEWCKQALIVTLRAVQVNTWFVINDLMQLHGSASIPV